MKQRTKKITISMLKAVILVVGLYWGLTSTNSARRGLTIGFLISAFAAMLLLLSVLYGQNRKKHLSIGVSLRTALKTTFVNFTSSPKKRKK